MKKILSLAALLLLISWVTVVLANDSGNEDMRKYERKFDKIQSWALNTTGLVCVKTAVEKKETAISAAYANYASGVLAALSTRKAGLISAYDKTTTKEIKATIKKSWNDYRSAIKIAKKDLQKAKKEAYKSFKAEIKACKPSKSLNWIDQNGEYSDIQ